MELTRKWWRHRPVGVRGQDDRFTLPTIDDFQPLDTQEQEEIVRSFERSHQQQSRLWRGVFGLFLLAYVGFLGYSIFQQAFYPWEQRYHAYFMEDVNHWMVICAASTLKGTDWVAILACFLAGKGMLHNSRSHQRLMWYSFYVGLLIAVFWLYYMLRLPRFRWDIIWLPLGPLSAAGMCLYVNHLLKSSQEEIKTLESYMYEYKRR